MTKIFEFVRDKLAPVVGNTLATAFNLITRAIGLAIDGFAKVFEIIGKIARFLGFDFDMEVKKATTTMNANTDSTAAAYRQFQMYSNTVSDEVVPALTSFTSATNSAVAATTAKTAATKALNTELAYQSALEKEIAKTKGDPTGAKTVAAAIARRNAASAGGTAIPDIDLEGSLVDAFKGTAERYLSQTGEQLDPLNAARYVLRYSDLFEAGLGGLSTKVFDNAVTELIREGLLVPGTGGVATYQGTGGRSAIDLLKERTVNININGTVINPEGTARAIQNVLQDSSARSGAITIGAPIGIE